MLSSATADQENPSDNRTGVALNITGLLCWLSAMLLAVAGPLLGIAVPPLLIIGIVAFSAVFSFLSIPNLLRSDRDQDRA
jgi:FtsH-binding integral membrane protein